MWARRFDLRCCHRCKKPILAGASDGFSVLADPYALTSTGQLAALLEYRRIYRAMIHGKRIMLWRHESHNIAAGTLMPIVAEHICRQPLTGIDPVASRVFLDIITPTMLPEECPF